MNKLNLEAFLTVLQDEDQQNIRRAKSFRLYSQDDTESYHRQLLKEITSWDANLAQNMRQYQFGLLSGWLTSGLISLEQHNQMITEIDAAIAGRIKVVLES